MQAGWICPSHQSRGGSRPCVQRSSLVGYRSAFSTGGEKNKGNTITFGDNFLFVLLKDFFCFLKNHKCRGQIYLLADKAASIKLLHITSHDFKPTMHQSQTRHVKPKRIDRQSLSPTTRWYIPVTGLRLCGCVKESNTSQIEQYNAKHFWMCLLPPAGRGHSYPGFSPWTTGCQTSIWGRCFCSRVSSQHRAKHHCLEFPESCQDNERTIRRQPALPHNQRQTHSNMTAMKNKLNHKTKCVLCKVNLTIKLRSIHLRRLEGSLYMMTTPNMVRGTYLKILKSWSISESPWNSGFLVASSAKMVPVLQTSTGVEYRAEPRRTSGARYHRVTTWNTHVI